MNVLLVNEIRDWGGAEEYTLRLAAALREKGWSPVIAANTGSELAKRAEAAGLDVERIMMASEMDVVAVSRLRALIGRLGNPLVHPQTQRDHVLSAFASRLACAGKVLRYQHIHFPKGWSVLAKTAYLHLTEKVLCVSHAIKEDLRAGGVPEAILDVVYTGIDTARFEPFLEDRSFRSDEGLVDDAIAIGCVGSLFETKGQEFVVRALPLLREEYPKARCFFAGDGGCRPELEALAAELGVGHMVRFLGFRNDVPRIIASMDIMVISSVWEEPGALTNMECMFMEKPLVSTRVGGTPELVLDGETGVLVPPRDPGEMAAALKKIIENPQWAAGLGAAGGRRVRENFTLSRMADRVIDVYRAALARRAPRDS